MISCWEKHFLFISSFWLKHSLCRTLLHLLNFRFTFEIWKVKIFRKREEKKNNTYLFALRWISNNHGIIFIFFLAERVWGNAVLLARKALRWGPGPQFHKALKSRGVGGRSWSFCRAEQRYRGEEEPVLLITLCACCHYKNVPAGAICTVNKQGLKWKKKKKKQNEETIPVFFWLNLKIWFSVFKWWCNEEYFLFSKILE